MDIIVSKRDVKIVALVVALFGSWFAYGTYDTHIMEEELSDIARGHMDEWFDDPRTPYDRNEYDYLAIVDSGKAFHFFGRGWGVIHFYQREKGDVDMETFKGLEYYYARKEGEWVLMDSAGCGAVEHHLRAFDQMLAKGMDVPDRVYDKALGIDFDYRKFLKDYEGHDHTELPAHRDGDGHHDHQHDRDHSHNDDAVQTKLVADAAE